VIASRAQAAASRAFAIVLAIALTPTRATAAEESPKIVAEKLFSEGRAELERGRAEAACPMLAESQRIDPAGGTALLLAICYEQQGRVATAWAAFRTARAMATRDGREDRAQVADERLQALEPKMSYLALTFTSVAAVPALQVDVDGLQLGGPSRALPIPVDAGVHVVRATAPGFDPFVKAITVTAPGTTQVEVGPLVTTTPVKRPGSARTIALITSVGVGVAAVGVTAVFGIRAMVAEERKPAHCSSDDTLCRNRASELEDRRATSATVSTVAGMVAAASAAGVIVLLVLPRTEERKTAWAVSPFADVGASVRIRF
jgi:hypothetical protein